MSRQPCQTPTVVLNQSVAAVDEDGTSGLVIEVIFDDLDKVGADVVLPIGLHAKPCHRLS